MKKRTILVSTASSIAITALVAFFLNTKPVEVPTALVIRNDSFVPSYPTKGANDVSPNLNINYSTGITTYNASSVVGQQLGIETGTVEIGFSSENGQNLCVVTGISPDVTGSLNFDYINNNGTPGRILRNNVEYQLIGTQILWSDFSRQNIDNNFTNFANDYSKSTYNGAGENNFTHNTFGNKTDNSKYITFATGEYQQPAKFSAYSSALGSNTWSTMNVYDNINNLKRLPTQDEYNNKAWYYGNAQTNYNFAANPSWVSTQPLDGNLEKGGNNGTQRQLWVNKDLNTWIDQNHFGYQYASTSDQGLWLDSTVNQNNNLKGLVVKNNNAVKSGGFTKQNYLTTYNGFSRFKYDWANGSSGGVAKTGPKNNDYGSTDKIDAFNAIVLKFGDTSKSILTGATNLGNTVNYFNNGVSSGTAPPILKLINGTLYGYTGHVWKQTFSYEDYYYEWYMSRVRSYHTDDPSSWYRYVYNEINRTAKIDTQRWLYEYSNGSSLKGEWAEQVERANIAGQWVALGKYSESHYDVDNGQNYWQPWDTESLNWQNPGNRYLFRSWDFAGDAYNVAQPIYLAFGERSDFSYKHVDTDQNSSGYTQSGLIIIDTEIDDFPFFQSNYQNVTTENAYDIVAPSINSLVLPSSYDFSVANNTFWGYTIKNLVIGTKTHFSNTRPGIYNESATSVFRNDQVRSEPDIFLIDHLAENAVIQGSTYKPGSYVATATQQSGSRASDYGGGYGLYFAKNIPFANCKINNLYIYKKDTNLTNESFKSVLQITRKDVVGQINTKSFGNIYMGSIGNNAVYQPESWGGNNGWKNNWIRTGVATISIPLTYTTFANGDTTVNGSSKYVNTYAQVGDGDNINRYSVAFSNAYIGVNPTSSTANASVWYRDRNTSQVDPGLSNYYVYNGVNSANPISNITASNFGTATIIQGDAARKAFGIDNTKQWRRLPKVDSGSSNSRNAWNDTSVFPSYSSSTMTGVNAGSLYEKTVFPLICDNNGSLVTKTNGVKMPNYTTQSVEEDPKTHLYIKLPTTVSNKIYVPQGKLTPSNTTTWVDSIKTKFAPSYSNIDYIKVSTASKVEARLYNTDNTDYSVKAIVQDKEVTLNGLDDSQLFSIDQAFDPNYTGSIPTSNFNRQADTFLSPGTITNMQMQHVSGLENVIGVSYTTENPLIDDDNEFNKAAFKFTVNPTVANTIPKGTYIISYNFVMTLFDGATYHFPLTVKWNNTGSNAIDNVLPESALIIEDRAEGVYLNGIKPDVNLNNYSVLNIPNDVTHIASNAFKDLNSNLTIRSIIQNATYTTIPIVVEAGAFENTFANLETLKLTSVKDIRDRAFADNEQLANITLSNDLLPSTGGSTLHIGYQAFSNCSNSDGSTGLKNFSSAYVTSLSSYAFENNPGLVSVNTPALVDWANGYNFNNCPNLKSITIGAQTIYSTPISYKEIDYNNLLGGTYFTDGPFSSACSIYVRNDNNIYDLYVSNPTWINEYTANGYTMASLIKGYSF